MPLKLFAYHFEGKVPDIIKVHLKSFSLHLLNHKTIISEVSQYTQYLEKLEEEGSLKFEGHHEPRLTLGSETSPACRGSSGRNPF